MPTYRKVIDKNGNTLNGKRYRDVNTGIWYSVSKNGEKTALDLDRNGRQIKSKYIGGINGEVQQKYWKQAPIMRHITDSIADRYNIDSSLLRNRLVAEDYINNQIRQQNKQVLSGVNNRMFSNYDDTEIADVAQGFKHFGLDDVGLLIKEGKVKPINEKYYEADNVNELGRKVLTAEGLSAKDNIGLMAATLKYYKDLAKERNPQNNDIQNSILANMYYHRGPYTNYKNINEYDYTKRQTKKFGGRIHLDEI